MQTLYTLVSLTQRITLPKGWWIQSDLMGDGFYIQIKFWGPDSHDPSVQAIQSCRKWYISRHATDTEVVRTVHKAGIAAIEHEFNEQFKFDGVAIANPHLSCIEMAQAKLSTDSRS